MEGDHPDSIVYINGVSTDKKIEDIQQIGPILGDTQVAFYTEKKTPTNEIAVSYEEVGVAGSEVYFTYPSNYSFVVKTPEQIAEENFDRRQLELFVLEFRDDYELALHNKDFDYIRDYLAPGSLAYEELVEFIGDIGNDYYDYDFFLNEVVKTDLTVDEAYVTTYEEFYFTNHNFDTVFYQREKQYDVRLNEFGEFEIHKIHILDTKRYE